MTSRSARLLLVCDYPPSVAGGAAVIARRVFSSYDQASLTVLCDRRQFDDPNPVISSSHLPCRHVTVGNVEGNHRMRPRRVFGRIADDLNSLRVGHIVRIGSRLIEDIGVEAIFTIPWRPEFALAALELARLHQIPLDVWETDDWQAINPRGISARRVKSAHGPLLSHARRRFFISPTMASERRAQYGVDGSLLFHFVEAQPAPPRSLGDPIRLVYAGSVNEMFRPTLDHVAAHANAGWTHGGNRVELHIYGGSCPKELLGPFVQYHGLMPVDDVPGVLATADVLLMALSFGQEPRIVKLVGSCIYTKTIDYLASGRPVLLVAPSRSAQVRHYGHVTSVVDEMSAGALEAGLAALLDDPVESQRRATLGLDLVRRDHSEQALQEGLLAGFLLDG